MGDHFIRIRTNVIAFQAMKVRRFIVRAEIFVVSAVRESAMHVRSELLEVVAHQLIESLVPGGMLNETRFVTKRVEAIFPNAVEVTLMVAIAAVRKVAVLIKAEL